jgi:hypothetical protein
MLHADCIFIVMELITDYVREAHQTQLNRVRPEPIIVFWPTSLLLPKLQVSHLSGSWAAALKKYYRAVCLLIGHDLHLCDWCSRCVLIPISNVTSDKRLLAEWLGCSMKWLLGGLDFHTCFKSLVCCYNLCVEILSFWSNRSIQDSALAKAD